ncbi:MAG: AMP-binding protein [Lentilitoribacter sp.]
MEKILLPAPRAWVPTYPSDIPAELPPLEHPSLSSFFEKSLKQNAALPAHTSMGKTITYGDWDKSSENFAGWLQSLGLKPGTRIAVMLPNILQSPIVIASILRAGFVLTSINPLYTPRELKNQLNDSGAEAIIVLENFAHTLQQVVSETNIKHVCVTSMGDMFIGDALGLKSQVVNLVVRRVKKMVPKWSLPDHVPYRTALSIGAKSGFTPHENTHDDIALLQYTGGTTGVPKAAMITHGNLLSNIEQSAIWVESAIKSKKHVDQITFLCALPLYHIFALTVNLMISTRLGSHNLLIANPRDIPGFVKELEKHPVHIFAGLNTLFNALMNNPDFRKLDFSELLISASGGMKTQTAVANRWETITGSIIHEAYGLSETSPVVCGNLFDDDHFNGTIGIPVSSTIVEVRGEDNKELPFGEIGEICVRGPQVMKGYWNNPEETENVMTEDGFFKTGDIGLMSNEGYITLVDRVKDMILVSGFNVYPNELEDVIALLDGVQECAAIGIQNTEGHEDIKLFVVRSNPELTDEQIRDYCKTQLTNYKRPKHIVFRDELPKSNVGKVLRRELRET